MKLDVPRAVVLHVLWAACLAGALLVGAGGLLPFRLGAAGPDQALALVVHAELFFVIFVWPLFIPRILTAREGGPAAWGEGHLLGAQVLLLLVVALPVALVGQDLADAEVSALFRGQVMVLGLGFFVTALHDALGAARVRRGYFLGAFLASALLPFLGYLSIEFGVGSGLGFLAAVSPFWGAAQLAPGAALGWAPLVQSAIFGVLALGLFAAAPFLRRVDAPATPG